MIRVVLFDLDGVIRHFDPQYAGRIERESALEPGSLERVAFRSPLIDDVTTGRITRAEWVRRVGGQIGDGDAAQRWSTHPAEVDQSMLRLSDEIRGLGLRTAILTNGTDTIPAEIAAHGISDRFDAVFNSAEIGFAKPDIRAFQHVLDALGASGSEVFFTDDSVSKLVGAEKLSMRAHVFRGERELREALSDAGVKVAPHA